MITYGLGTITYPPKDTSVQSRTPATNINIPIGLSEDEYNGIAKAILRVGSIFRYTDMYSMTGWNFEDLLNTVNAYLQAFIKKDISFLSARDITLNINKSFLNLLASFRFYLNFMEKHLSDDFGGRVDLVNRFKEYCSKEYDENFSYRFVYHIRNYAQHHNFVVSSINFDERPDNENQFTRKYNLRINIAKADLLGDKSFKKEVRVEINNLPGEINLVEHISSWMLSFERIHNQITSQIIPLAFEEAKLVTDYASKLTYDPNDNLVVPVISTIDHSEKNNKQIISSSYLSLPINDAQRILDYCKAIKSETEFV
jgi:hypothetical protein